MFKFFKSRQLFSYLFLGILTSIYFLFFLNKGITLYDEGYIAEASYLTFLGKIPYKDFYFQYTPLTIWLGSLIYKIFGAGILQLRWISLISSVITVLLGYSIAKTITNNKTAILIALALIAWGFPQANFLWPSSLATLFLFAECFSFLKLLRTKKIYYAGLMGLFAGLCLLAKQNLGLILFASSFLLISLISFRKMIYKNIWMFAGAFFLIFLGSLLILLCQNPNLSGLEEFFSRSLSIAKGHALLTWYPKPVFPEFNIAGAIKWLVKIILYYLPLIYIFYSVFKYIKNKKNNIFGLVIFSISSLFFFAMIWPTADLAHFTFGIPALILAFLAGTLSKNNILKTFSKLCLIFFIAIGFYKTFFMNYYTFETPYLNLKNIVSVRGKKIITDEKHFVILDALNKRKDSYKNKSVFVYSYAPMIYFALDKIPLTYELYAVESLLSEKAIKKVISDLEKIKPDVIFLESWRETDSEITKYIRENYREKEKIWDFLIFTP